MSVVSQYTSDEAAKALKRQNKQSTLLSLAIAVLLVVLFGLLLFLVMIPGWFVETKTIVTYSAPLSEDLDNIRRPEVTHQLQRKAAAPSSSVAKVLASSMPSAVAIPVPEFSEDAIGSDFGSGDDFGEGIGSGGGENGTTGGTTFFGQTSKAERICYVIDYSRSMHGQRQELMRKELADSLREIPLGSQYQMIFFAGPAWVAGSDVLDPGAKEQSVIKGLDGEEYVWEANNIHDWEAKKKRQKAEWIEATRPGITKSRNLVKKTDLVWGTEWQDALEMALEMSPPPEVIYFMTDGTAGSETEKVARRISSKARAKGIKINCVALMEPKAFEALDDMARRTGGHFTKVMEKGKVEKVR